MREAAYYQGKLLAAAEAAVSGPPQLVSYCCSWLWVFSCLPPQAAPLQDASKHVPTAVAYPGATELLTNACQRITSLLRQVHQVSTIDLISIASWMLVPHLHAKHGVL